MNWIDYIILGIIFFSTLIGMKRGLVKELLSLIFLVAAFFIAINYSESLASYFTESTTTRKIANSDMTESVSYLAICVSFLILLFGTIIIGAIINLFLNLFLQTGIIGLTNHLFGFIFGFLRGVLFSLAFVFILQFNEVSNESPWQQSRLLPLFTPWILKLNEIASPKLADFKTKLQSLNFSLDDIHLHKE